MAKPTTPARSQREKLLDTVRDFNTSIENLAKSLARLRSMRDEVVRTYIKKYGPLPKGN